MAGSRNATFERALGLDAEDVIAHDDLMPCHRMAGNSERAARHRDLHEEYKPDENARERVATTHRAAIPAVPSNRSSSTTSVASPDVSLRARPGQEAGRP